MATITTAEYLETAARTASEAFTINGGSLTIRTDTRVHANAPASMTGALGAITISTTLGGQVLLDGRNVRWLAYNTGSGTVPAIGTNVTQGGVTSSYLLGVWSSLTAAPTAVGAAMPATGFLKFREVDGAFAAGALTGIGASATGADVVGWIEVVQRQSVATAVPRLGSYTVRGDWFYLDNTTGVVNQQLQVPTNGGGAGTHVPAVWIETAPGSGEYESYPALGAGLMLTTVLGTDERAKFVCTSGDGVVRIGHNGTDPVGFVPVAGCRVRIPNVLGRQVVSGAEATNVSPHVTLSTRPDFSTISAGVVDFEYFLSDWYFAFSAAYATRAAHVGLFTTWASANDATATELLDIAIGNQAAITATALALTSLLEGGTIADCKFVSGSAASGSAILTACAGLVLDNTYFIMAYIRTTVRPALSLATCTSIQATDCYVMNGPVAITTSKGVRINDIDFTDRPIGNTTSAVPMSAFTFTTGCEDCILDGVTFGYRGVLAGYHNPYTAICYAATSNNIRCRNAGTRTSPLVCHPTTFAPQFVAQDAGNNSDIWFQRMYVTKSRSSTHTSLNTSKRVFFESVHSDLGLVAVLSNDSTLKGCRQAGPGVVSASIYGTSFHDIFMSDTAGLLFWMLNEPTASSAADEMALTLAGSVGGFTSGSSAAMQTVGDEITMTSQYAVLGHTGFSGQITTLGTLTQNFDYFYQIAAGEGAFGAEARLFSMRLRASGGAAGATTFTFTSIAGTDPQIGDYVWSVVGTHFAAGTYVTDVTGTTITVSAPILVSLTASLPIYFTSAAFVAESVDPAVGFRLRVRAEVMVAGTTNLLSSIRIGTTSTLVAQTDNLYPLDFGTLTITGLQNPSEIRVFDAANPEVEIAGAEDVTTGTFSVAIDSNSYPVVNVAVLALGYLNLRYTDVNIVDNATLAVLQTRDRQYQNP